MIATGIVVFLSVALILVKLPRLMLRALRRDLAIDLVSMIVR
jgi:hypothetical protein